MAHRLSLRRTTIFRKLIHTLKILHYSANLSHHATEFMPPSNPDNPIMTIGEVADYLKVTERTIYRLAGAKQIPAFKVGGSWRFSKPAIDGWIQDKSSMKSNSIAQQTQ